MSTQSLLPDNRSLLETALEKTIQQHLLQLGSVYPDLWDPMTVPVPLLPYLAQAKGVPDWGDDTEQAKRETVANIWQVQRQAGTRAAVKQAVAPLGFTADVMRGSLPYHLKVDLWREDVGTIEPDILARVKRRIGYVKSERDKLQLTLNASSNLQLYVGMAAGAACIVTSYISAEERSYMSIKTSLSTINFITQTVTECY